MTDWGIALIGVGGIIVGAIITEVRYWLDRKQRFRVMTFEKRLQVHQDAYRLCMEQALLMDELRRKGLEVSERFLKSHDETREWLNRNCLYLDKRSHKAIIEAFFATSIYGRDFAEKRETINQAYDYAHSKLEDCLKFTTEGIGAEYLPETERNQN
jgi:hypothetical protein